MSRCGVCRATVRKTTTVYVRTDGALKRSRVCNGCASETIRVHVGGAPSKCTCGELAIYCHGCAVAKSKGDGDVTRLDSDAICKRAAKHVRNIAKAYTAGGEGVTPYSEGRVAGLEQAANIVQKGGF